MLRTVIALGCALVLGACSDKADDARNILEQSLGSPKGLEFRNTAEFPGGVVCGEYGGHQSDLGATSPFQRFLTIRGLLFKPPRDQDWEFFCSAAPAEVLLNSAGIGLYDSRNAELAQITADLSLLDTALESYYRDHFVYPTMRQGLEALVNPPENLRTAGKYPENGYLGSIPVDPWGRPYLYQEEQWGRTKGHFTITTLGADGVESGSGKNADVSTVQLKYLQHIAFILTGR